MADTPVILRRATAEDAAAMARVHARSWQSAYRGVLPDEIIAGVVATETTRAGRLRDRLGDTNDLRRGWVATVGNAVIGMAIAGPSRDDESAEIAELQAIYLDPDFMGRGYGRDLLQTVVDDLGDLGFVEATLWVLEANARARRFYEAAGWHVDGAKKQEERPGGTLHVVRYRRALRGQHRGRMP